VNKTVALVIYSGCFLSAVPQSQSSARSTFPPSAFGQASAAVQAEPRSPRPTIAVFDFALQGAAPSAGSGLSVRACPLPAAPPSASMPPGARAVVVKPELPAEISNQLQKRFSSKANVLVNPLAAEIPLGAVIVGGCITKADAGNAAGRLVGMNIGASHLQVHVIVRMRSLTGMQPIDSFDVDVKGANMLPPLGPVGLAAHAARDTRETLSADASKVAKKIAKHLAEDLKPEDLKRAE
jgi:hypothetical protein